MNANIDSTYQTLFRRYYPRLLFYAMQLLGEEDEAEDVVQDVFVELWKRKDSAALEEQIKAFLYRSVYTRSLNALKHRNIQSNFCAAQKEIHQQRIQFYQPDHNEIIQRIEDQELKKEIYEAINELPEKCRVVFKLSYLRDMKNREIADTLGVSQRTVEAHMYKALRFLRTRLEHLWMFLLILFSVSE